MLETANYQTYLDALKSKYIDYPAVVSIETYAYCNAACNFCPIHKLTRKGEMMPDSLIDKLITDLGDIPTSHPFEINLSRVNEPFLDHRIFDIAALINKRLPHASLVWFSNGTPLTRKNIEKLGSLKRVNRLNISLNEYQPESYQKTMKLPMEKTLRILRDLHHALSEGHLSFPITLSRVGDGTEEDLHFVTWSETHFPAFSVVVSARSDWLGLVEQQASPIPDVGCSQWFKLHILADGRDAYCCIDAEGRWTSANSRDMHLLDIIITRPSEFCGRLIFRGGVCKYAVCAHC